MTAKRAEVDEAVGFGLSPGLRPMNEAEFEAFLKEGEDAFDRGDVVPHEVVVAEMKAYSAEQRVRRRIPSGRVLRLRTFVDFIA